jgi:hypothetical protein
MLLVMADTKKQAKAYCNKKYGFDGWPYFVALATDEDKEHFAAMNGRIHDARQPSSG